MRNISTDLLRTDERKRKKYEMSQTLTLNRKDGAKILLTINSTTKSSKNKMQILPQYQALPRRISRFNLL